MDNDDTHTVWSNEGSDGETETAARARGGDVQAALGTGRAVINTRTDAYDVVSRLVSAQLRLEPASFNAPCAGDKNVRSLFYTVLDNSAQRCLYLETAADRKAWHRLRPLFGAPPFSFLNAGDAYMLRAGGFASRRRHMASIHSFGCAAVSQFGHGQWEDDTGRLYRVQEDRLVRESANVAELFCGRDVVLNVKVPHPRDNLDASTAAQRFPRVGEPLLVRRTKKLCRLLGVQQSSESTRLVVRRALMRSVRGRTGTIIARVE